MILFMESEQWQWASGIRSHTGAGQGCQVASPSSVSGDEEDARRKDILPACLCLCWACDSPYELICIISDDLISKWLHSACPCPSQSLFRLMGSNSLFRYVSWVSSGSGEICHFSNSKSLLSTTFPVFKPKKWFCTISKAMAIEKMNTCVDRCLIIIVIFVFSGSLPAVLLNLEKAAVTLVVISTIRDSFHM